MIHVLLQCMLIALLLMATYLICGTFKFFFRHVPRENQMSWHRSHIDRKTGQRVYPGVIAGSQINHRSKDLPRKDTDNGVIPCHDNIEADGYPSVRFD